MCTLYSFDIFQMIILKVRVREFPIPTATAIELKLISIIYHDVIHVKYIDKFFSLVNFISGSIIIFLLTDFYRYIMQIIRQNIEYLNELNLSLFWCFYIFINSL